MLQLTFRRFLRELDKAPGGNNLQYILKCPCIPFFGNQGLHNEIMLGGNGRRSGVMCEGSPYNCQFWSRDFGGKLPGIVFTAMTFSLDEVLESSPVPTTVEDLFYFLLRFSVDDYGRWVVLCLSACNWVIWGWSELHHVEHRMELLHPV